MASKDDDTLPLSGLSEEMTVDVSVDEDLIPTTQPESSERKNKNSDSKCISSSEEVKSSSHYNSGSTLEDTQSLEIRINQTTQDEDKSIDHIPDIETKETPDSFVGEDFSAKEKLRVFQAEFQDSFKDQTNSLPESPALESESFSIVLDTPTKVPPCKQETVLKREESATEILVNDSAETVNLEPSPVKVKSSQSEMAEENSQVSYSMASTAERCEETQIFEYSSVLLLDQPSSEKSELTPQKPCVQERTDDDSQIGEGISSVVELSKKAIKESVPKIKGNISLNQEVPSNSITAEQNSSSIIMRKIDFKLSVSCFVTINTKTNKILQKTITDVDELPKSKPKSVPFEPISDNTSDKSKRQSTSSSGSVYSDKTGLPFALPKRVSMISDHTDSSEEEFSFFPKRERRALERMPWGNEYLLPLKMDDIMQISIENQELLKRPNIIPSPRKARSRGGDRVNHLKDILESSSPERTSTPILESGESQPVETSRLGELPEKEKTGTSTQIFVTEEKQSEENLERSNLNENAVSEENVQCSDREDQVAGEEEESKPQDSVKDMEQVEGQRVAGDKSSSVVLCNGLPVLARWTDKRYYSGVLSGSAKYDRWEVKFYDGALKTVREDLIIPTEWLKAGALVFALMKDKYVSGQIVDVKKGKETRYIVELDEEKKQVPVKITDLRMTDVMAGIIREKYKPVSCTPLGKADIDFDNVLSGKRLREQKTPLRPQVTLEKESSRGKNKSSSKAKKNVRDPEITETPRNETGRGTRGLKSENGHLVEDKVISADSPSGNETGGTPLRGTSKELRRKAKPRSLSYVEEMRSGRRKSQSYLRSDGTPVPGTSGVKFKKQKINSKTPNVGSPTFVEATPVSGVRSTSKKIVTPSKTTQSTERSRRKRKLDESVEDSSQKTLPKDESSRPKRRTRN